MRSPQKRHQLFQLRLAGLLAGGLGRLSPPVAGAWGPRPEFRSAFPAKVLLISVLFVTNTDLISYLLIFVRPDEQKHRN